jgi:hypothetical protein
LKPGAWAIAADEESSTEARSLRNEAMTFSCVK